MQQLGLGGSCHWCTEAIFQSLRGVTEVRQGFIAPAGEEQALSEAVLITFDPDIIGLQDLVAVHLHTHSCTSEHSLRGKYRSAVYTFDIQQMIDVEQALQQLQPDFDQPVITQALAFGHFEASPERYQNYFSKKTDKPFCQAYIHPKLQKLRRKFSRLMSDIS